MSWFRMPLKPESVESESPQRLPLQQSYAAISYLLNIKYKRYNLAYPDQSSLPNNVILLKECLTMLRTSRWELHFKIEALRYFSYFSIFVF